MDIFRRYDESCLYQGDIGYLGEREALLYMFVLQVVVRSITLLCRC